MTTTRRIESTADLAWIADEAAFVTIDDSTIISHGEHTACRPANCSPPPELLASVIAQR